jgi:hypothetical protein
MSKKEMHMGMHLVNKAQDEFGISILSWYKVLNLAYICGWVPAGTVAPEDWESESPWDGRYHSSDGQWITSEDAARFADALANGLDDIPDMVVGEGVTLRLRDMDDVADGGSIDRATHRYTRSPFEYFSGPARKQRIRELIAFCRRGGFLVW